MDSERNEARDMTNYTFDAELFSDFYKDVNGFRPRGHEFYTAEDARKQELWDQLVANMEREIAEDDARKARAEADFAALVQRTIDSGAADEDTAVRWLLQAGDVDAEITEGDYVAYVYDLNYNSRWVAVFNRVLNELRQEAA